MRKIRVTVKYNFPKAGSISLQGLKRDLIRLKLPHPKAANLTVIAPGKFTFFWASPNSALVNTLTRRINPTPEEWPAHKALLDRLQIDELTLQNIPSNTTTADTRESPPTPHAGRPKRERMQSSDFPGTDPHEFGQVQQEVGGSLRPTKRIKVEPTDSDLLLDMGQSAASSYSASLRNVDTIGGSNPPVLMGNGVGGWQSSPSVVQSAFSIPPQSQSIPPKPPHAQHLPPARPPFMPISTPISLPHPPPEPRPPLLLPAHPGLPAPPRNTRKRGHSPERPPPPPTHKRYSKPAETQRLTRELWAVRREFAAGLAREAVILTQLKNLNGPEIPGTPAHTVSNLSERVMQTKLQLFEAALAAERSRREEAEQTLKDIERECRAPFVVPALLEAFISISKLTTEVADPRLTHDT